MMYKSCNIMKRMDHLCWKQAKGAQSAHTQQGQPENLSQRPWPAYLRTGAASWGSTPASARMASSELWLNFLAASCSATSAPPTGPPQCLGSTSASLQVGPPSVLLSRIHNYRSDRKAFQSDTSMQDLQVSYSS